MQEADYFVQTRHGAGGWLQRLLPRWFAPKREAFYDLRFALPLDAHGADALSLCSADVPPLEGRHDPIGSVRRVRGKVLCLDPRLDGDELVLLDYWCDTPPIWRIVQCLDFGVLPDDGPPVAVCCAMAPLVIAPPDECSVAQLMSMLEPRAAALAAQRAQGRELGHGLLFELREGDRVEVTGVTCEPSSSAKRFDVVGRHAAYRGTPRAIDLIVGDAPGTRLVVELTREGPRVKTNDMF